MLKKDTIEGLFILIFFSAFLFVGLSNAWEFKVRHDFPYGYLASDSFLHQSVADYFKETGQVKITPWYEVGGHQGVYDVHPPFLYYISAVFAKATSIEVHDSIYFMAFVMVILTSLALYFIIKHINKNVAIIALPFTILILSQGFNQELWWGNWLFVAGVLFLFINVWFLQKILEPKLFFLFGISLAATFLAHPPQAIFTALFISISLVFELFINITQFKIFNFKNEAFKKLKRIIFAGIISIVLVGYNIGVFYRGFYLLQGRSLSPVREGTFGFQEVSLGLLGIWLYIALAGVFIFLFYSITKKRDYLLPLFSAFMFVVSYMYLIGLGKRAYTHRFYWHFYLAFFIAFTIYFIIKLLANKLSFKKWEHACSVSIGVLFILFFSFSLIKITNPGRGLMDQYTWEGLKWIRQNTVPDSFIYYFYSDALSQAAALYNSHRVSFKINPQAMIEGIQQQKILRKYNFGLADSYHIYLCDFKLLSDAGYYINHLNLALLGNESYNCKHKKFNVLEYPPKDTEEKDICSAGYLYFNTQASQPALAQYNMAVAQTLLQNIWWKRVYTNPLVVILKNENVGIDCLE